MNAVVAYLQASWPTWLGIAVAALPSLITALTPYPKVEGFLKQLLQILNLFSILVHKDSPSTLKLPLTFSRPPAGQPVKYGRPSVAAAAVIFLGIFCSGSAHAQAVISTGPSLSLLEYRTGYVHPVTVAPGLGYQLNIGLFQREIFGESWDLLDFSFDLFGTAISNPQGAQAGDLSVSALICTLNSVFCLGVGTDIAGPNGGIVSGWTAKNNLFPVLSFSIPIEWSAPTSPPIGIEQGARGLKRGGTVYMGSP